MLRSTILSALCYALCVCCTAHLSVRLEAGKEDQQLSAIISNDGDEALKILHHPLTIFTTFPTDTLKFTAKTKEGVPPRFKGVQIKYSPQAAIAAGAFTFLAPGQSVQVHHDLNKAYDFSESAKGVYQIAISNTFYVVDNHGSVQTLHAEVFGTEMLISSRKNDPPSDTRRKRATFVGCSTSRQSIIISVATQAQAYATESLSYLNSHTAATPRYTTWFGTYTTARHATVVSHFNSIVSGGITNYNYDCTCTDQDVLAYIYPDDYKTVYLCNGFWTAPRLGFDGQAGILLKLSSEFTINGGASTQVYGQSACKALAISNPARAISNADSIEYFAINDPPLP